MKTKHNLVELTTLKKKKKKKFSLAIFLNKDN